MKVTVTNKRRDGKYMVRFAFDGQPNAFGGTYPGKVCNKILTAEQVAAIPEEYPDSDWTIPASLLKGLTIMGPQS